MSATADFLLELLSEEIPARMQARARNDLARMMAEALAAAGLDARRDHDLFDPAAAGADRRRPAARDRGGARGNQGAAQLGAAAGARGLPAQDRADRRTSSRSATASGSRAIDKPGPRHRRGARRGRRRDRARLPVAQVDALGRGVGLDRQPALGAAAAFDRRLARRGDRAGRDRRRDLRRGDARPPLPPSRRRSPSAARTTMSRNCAPATCSSTRPSARRSSAPARSRRPRMPASCSSRTKGWWSRMPG